MMIVLIYNLQVCFATIFIKYDCNLLIIDSLMCNFTWNYIDTGRLMAKYYLSFETMKSFSTLTGNEHLSDLVFELFL